jgi:hypothetical protein
MSPGRRTLDRCDVVGWRRHNRRTSFDDVRDDSASRSRAHAEIGAAYVLSAASVSSKRFSTIDESR